MDITIGTEADERKDDRRNQRYYRAVEAYASANIADHEVEGLDVFDNHGEEHERFFGSKLRGGDLDRMIRDLLDKRLFAEEIRDHCVAGKTNKVKVSLSHNRYKRYDKDPYITVHVSYRVPAIRPSEIVSEEEALALIDTDEISARLKTAVEGALEFLESRAKQLQHLNETEYLAKWIATTASKRAKEEIKFEARAGALREEFEAKLDALRAEAKQQTIQESRSITSEWDEKHIADCVKEGFTKEAAKSAPAFCDRFIESPDRERGGIFATPSSRPPAPKVKPEDLGYSE